MRAISARVGVAPPWHLRDLQPPDVLGLNCRSCRRDIAVPLESTAASYLCIYCADAEGISPIVEVPPEECSGQYYHEVTECL